MMNVLYIFITVKCVCLWMFVHQAESNCDLPFYYDDIYVSAEKGNIHANSSVISEYPLNIPSISQLDFYCKERREDTYLLKSTEDKVIFGQLTMFYLCLEIHQVTNATYYYFHGTGYDLFLQDFVFGAKITEATFEDVCTKSSDPRTFLMMVKTGAYDEGLLNTTCPQDILSVYASVNITSSAGTTTSNCPGTTMDMCTDRTSVAFTYNDTCSPAKMTSDEGKYSCLYSTTIGTSTYLGTWNQDTTVDGTDTFRFSCFVYSTSGDTLYATETPGNCTSTTTARDLGTASAAGVIIVAWDIILTCPDTSPGIPETPEDLTWLYYLAAALGLLLLLMLIFVASLCFYKKYGCICKRVKTIKFTLSHLNIASRHPMGRQESQIEILNDKENTKVAVVGKCSPSSNPDVPDIWKPKKEVDNFLALSAIFTQRKLPLLMVKPKVGPMYTDTIDDYLDNGIRRSYSQASLFRLDSGVFDDDLER